MVQGKHDLVQRVTENTKYANVPNALLTVIQADWWLRKDCLDLETDLFCGNESVIYGVPTQGVDEPSLTCPP